MNYSFYITIRINYSWLFDLFDEYLLIIVHDYLVLFDDYLMLIIQDYSENLMIIWS